MPLASGQHGDHRLAAAFSPQVQLGREPALAASQRFDVHPIPDSLVPARASRVLMGADDGGVYEVQVPIHLASGIGLSLQRDQNLIPDPRCSPAVEPARDRADRAIVQRQVAPGRSCPVHP
jgi:hypothetical protein